MPLDGVAFSRLSRGRIFNSYLNGVADFLIFGARQFFIFTISKSTRMFALLVTEVKFSLINLRNIHK